MRSSYNNNINPNNIMHLYEIKIQHLLNVFYFSIIEVWKSGKELNAYNYVQFYLFEIKAIAGLFFNITYVMMKGPQ